MFTIRYHVFGQARTTTRPSLDAAMKFAAEGVANDTRYIEWITGSDASSFNAREIAAYIREHHLEHGLYDPDIPREDRA